MFDPLDKLFDSKDWPISDIDEISYRIDKPSENIPLLLRVELLSQGSFVKGGKSRNTLNLVPTGLKRNHKPSMTAHYGNTKGKNGPVIIKKKNGKEIENKQANGESNAK